MSAPPSMPNDLLQPRPRAIMKEGRNRGEKERVNRKKKKKQASGQSGWPTNPGLRLGWHLLYSSASCWKGNFLEPSSHQSKGVAFHSLLHRNKTASVPLGEEGLLWHFSSAVGRSPHFTRAIGCKFPTQPFKLLREILETNESSYKIFGSSVLKLSFEI